MKIYNRFTGELIIEVEDIKKGLRGADLWRADLREADFRRADLRRADLWEADLWGANLRRANLRGADLRGANLREVNLRGADLRRADLGRADLREADLDFSCFPLWCGSFDIKADNKLLYQLCYHICKLDINTKAFKTIKIFLKPFANKFHRVDECGEIE